MSNLKTKTVILIVSILLLPVLAGCGKDKTEVKTIAVVNGEPVYLEDFKREVALRVRRNPSFKVTPDTLDEVLDLIIDKKLIIQEAVKNRLAEKDRFLDTITAFWEQTLIRDFIDYKNSESGPPARVAESEVAEYYDKLKTKATFRIARRSEREDIDILMKRAERGEEIEWDTTVSLSYEEVPSVTLSKAFDLAPGQMGVFEEGYMYYLVYVVSKEPVQVPPLEEARSRIEEKIRQIRRQQAFNGWLEAKRSSSDIKIDKGVFLEASGGGE